MSVIGLPRTDEDTPRSALSLLDRRATTATMAILLGLDGAAWWSTIGYARDMSSMAQGLAQAGAAMPFNMSANVFIDMWITMTVAMMLPTIAPIVLVNGKLARQRGAGPVPTVAFCSGYVAVWALTGVLPLAVLIALRSVAHGSTWLERTGGAVFILAGVYQFTSWKQRCLKECRTPATFLTAHDYGGGPVGAVRVGLSNGLCCLGSCGALMATLFAVGVMNLAWMAAIAVVFVAEKNWRHGVGLAALVAVTLVGLGVAVLVHPHLLGSVAFVHHRTMMSR